MVFAYDQLALYFLIITYVGSPHKQVDILISKNQALQILHLKHCVYNNETK